MAKKKTNKTKKTSQKLGGLFIQKRTDKRGNNYFIDRQGKRSKSIEYYSQWGSGKSTGRVKKESFDKTVDLIKEEDITDLTEARLIASDFEVLRRAVPQRKKELELIEGEETGIQLFFRAVDTVKDAEKGKAKVKILRPNSSYFKLMSYLDAIEVAHRFIDSVSDALDEMQEASEFEFESPLIYFRFQHEIKTNTFYIDFKNLIGAEDYALLIQLVKDNFEAYE